jgi:AcrR family transcriptional regulator
VFLELGFAGATMHEVARRAGVSKASLYSEHPSKDALFAAMVADWAVQGRGAMRPALEVLLAAGSVRDGLVTFARTMQAAVLDDGPLRMRRLVAAESPRFPDVAAQYVAASWDTNIDDLAGALAQLAARGELDLPNPRITAEHLTWMVVGGPLNAQTLGAPMASPNHLETLVQVAVETLLRTYSPR